LALPKLSKEGRSLALRSLLTMNNGESLMPKKKDSGRSEEGKKRENVLGSF
jgi:hypothetical protein